MNKINMFSDSMFNGLFVCYPKNLLPINKRTQDNFEKHFRAAGLEQIVEYQVSKRH